MADKVKMKATWDFSGPEGAHGGRQQGVVLRGQEFTTTEQRAQHLTRRGKAVRVDQKAQAAANQENERRRGTNDPRRTKREEPKTGDEEHPLKGRSIPEVLQAVDSGQVSAEDALRYEHEERGDDPRSTLVEELERRAQAPGDDNSDGE